MRKALWLLVMGLVLMCSFTVVADEAVFMGLKWGDSLDVLGEVREHADNYLIKDFYGYYEEGNRLVYLSSKDFINLNFKIYSKVNEIKSLGTVPVDEVLYGFINGRLAMIQISSPDPIRLSEIVEARYGRFTLTDQVSLRRNEYFYYLERFDKLKAIGDTFVGLSGSVVIQTKGTFQLHSISLFEEAKVMLKQRKQEKEEAYKRRVEFDSQSW